MYDGYLDVGGKELVNAARTSKYVKNLSSFGLKDCQDCGDLETALGDTYTTPQQDGAPWYDPSDPETGLFYGIYPLAIEGLSSSTHESINADLVGNGSVQTYQRRGGRDLMVRGVMFAKTRSALDKGLSWLDNTLDSEACQGENARLFSDCPKVVDYPPEAFSPVDVGLGDLLRTNLAENPNIDTGSETDLDTPLLRENLVLNPSLFLGVFDGQDGTFTVTEDFGDSGDMNNVPYSQALIDVPNTVSPVMFWSGNMTSQAASVVGGETYTASLYVSATQAGMYSAHVSVAWFDGSGGFLSQDDGSDAPVTPVWTRLSDTWIAPSGAEYAQIVAVFTGTDGVAGEAIRVGGSMIEQTDTVKPLIAGYVSLDTNLESRFSGPANGSTTQAFPRGVPYPLSESPLRMDSGYESGQLSATLFRRADPLESQVWQAALIPRPGSSSNDTYWNATDSDEGALFFQPGRTYRVSAEITLRRPQVAASGMSRDRAIAVVTDAGGTLGIDAQSPSAPNTTGPHRVSVTFTVGSDVTTSYLRLYNGSSDPTDVVYWDEILVEDVTDGVPASDSFFDGNTYDTEDFYYQWRGADGRSISDQFEQARFSDEVPNWNISSGSVTDEGEYMLIEWDESDCGRNAWRRVTGLIPGENYQLRVNSSMRSTRVRVGGKFTTPEENFSKNPRWIGSVFDGNVASPVPEENQFDEEFGGPLGFGWRKLVYPSTVSEERIKVVDVIDIKDMARSTPSTSQTVSVYAYSGVRSSVNLVVRLFDVAGIQVVPDLVLDSSTSNGEWIRLSGQVENTTPNIGWIQVEVQYVPQGSIISGTEFGVWGTRISPDGDTDYFDGDFPGFSWVGTPHESGSETDVEVLASSYFDIGNIPFSGTSPVDYEVMDFIPQSDEVTLYFDQKWVFNTEIINRISVLRTPGPGVVSYGTNLIDMVPPSDGWYIPAIPELITEIYLDSYGYPRETDIQQYPYSGLVYSRISRPRIGVGGVEIVPIGSGPRKTCFGLEPGTSYRMSISYYDGATVETPEGGTFLPVPTEPVLSGTISQSISYSEDDTSSSGNNKIRIIEFIPLGSSVMVALETMNEVELLEDWNVVIEIDQFMIEKILETPYTDPPNALRPVTRHLRNVSRISGPQMTGLRRTSCGWMAQVTFGLRAGDPGVYREPVFAGGLPTSSSYAIDAIPCIDGIPARVNFMPIPSAENGLETPDEYGSNYATYPQEGALSRVNDLVPGPVVGEWYVQADGADELHGHYLIPEPLPSGNVVGLLPGAGIPYTHSVYIAADTSGQYELELTPFNVIGGIEFYFRTVELVAYEWTRIEFTFTIPQGDGLLLFDCILRNQLGVPVKMWMDGYMIEPGLTASPVWDETTPGASWSGTPVESALLLATPPEDITADPDCPPIPLPPSPPVVKDDCVDDPGSYQRSVITIAETVVPRNLTAFPILTVQAGDQDVRQARIRFWENPDRLSLEELPPCDFIGDIIISYIPAGATLVIDAVEETAVMTLNGLSQDASHLLTGSAGAPTDWPELSGGIQYLVSLDLDSNEAYTDTRMTVDLVVRD